MKFQDYYEVLGVAREADAAAVKKAYRKLALKWHPDRHPESGRTLAEETFKRVSEAYEVLSDPEKRAKYERFGQNWQHGQDFEPEPGQRTMSREDFEAAFGGQSGFSDFFQQVFGDEMRRDFGAGPKRHARYRYRGADVRAELRLPIRQALERGKQRFEVPARSSCPACGGTGFLQDHVCPTCAGLGQVRARKAVDLEIPAAVRDGMTLRLRGLGEPGEGGGDSGDLHLVLRLEADESARLVDGMLELRVVLWPWDAHSGTKVDVRTARGTVALTVPSGSRSGTRLRLREQGFSEASGAHGDCFVRLEIDLPPTLTARQEELLRELSQASRPSGAGTGGPA